MDRGVEQLVARWAHNPKVRGSNPLPATKYNGGLALFMLNLFSLCRHYVGTTEKKISIFHCFHNTDFSKFLKEYDCFERQLPEDLCRAIT